ncbi:TIGR03088 family PEP-CTERM/XrtA system glycosyltransferase [Methylohalobius crimeensis]|uniref:TIGR03088 family PEP-CTERM/XrtA system glycosyltransferase n=1 Tax=Methylohalobius crimeensis TaxID=244365 RepID=UPI0003B484CB|nr:TIGR03088 family PEP-CTERM/XrtA system glycosyltransferase [Methylohalobius crimeensis]
MAPPLIVHVIHRLGVGGLENGLVNLINHLPEEKYRHAIVCLTESDAFKQRIRREVEIYELHKRTGQDMGLYDKIFKLFKQLRPAIVHTRNLATLECQLPAWLAGVPIRIHGEHGWDVFDPDGTNVKYRWLRRAFRPLIHAYIPLSRQLEDYLVTRVKVTPRKITRICNGVDTVKFHPPKAGREAIPGCPFSDPNSVRIGTVGRMHGVKDQTTLVKAFIRLLENHRPELKAKARLIAVGDGPLRQECIDLLEQAGMQKSAWLPGERGDIPAILRGLDFFVLPSRAEGISNTILEAMATGLPVIATEAGGNPELVRHEVSGTLVPVADPDAMAAVLVRYVESETLRSQCGEAGLQRVQADFSLAAMVVQYQRIYDNCLRIS